MRRLFYASMLLIVACGQQDNTSEKQKHTTMDSLQVTHLNPDGLIKNPAFTNVVTVQGNGNTIYIGEMNANDVSGKVVGKGDLKVQTEQVLKNIEIALEAAGAKLDNVIKWNLHVVQGQDLQAGFAAFQKVWGKRPNPPAITMAFVSGLANQDYLVGIEAIAVVGD